mgnify:CR=1 FL=1
MERIKATYFGYDTYKASLNMAIDEVLEKEAGEKGITYLRFYDTPSNAIVLSISDHPSVIKANKDEIEITRRTTGGKPIFLGENTLSYSIEAQIKEIYKEAKSIPDPNDLHRILGEHMLIALKYALGLEEDRIKLGETYSITVDGLPIAGHAQHITNKAIIYHGVVAIDKWDADYISKRLLLRDGDFEKLNELPYAKKFSRYDTKTLKLKIIEQMLKTIKQIDDNEKSRIIEKAKELEEGIYSDIKWVFREEDSLKKNSTFCFLYNG